MAEQSPLNSTGLTEDEAKEVHRYFMRGTQMWVLVAAVAHVLVYAWKPWFPG
jgi:light-harvesting complex 1 beta chain